MKYCLNCLQPDTRPQTIFTKNLCPACKYVLKAKNFDNDSEYLRRFSIIKKICNIHKSSNKFDCIIGVSGGKDSTRQALWVREKLGMKPLLACLSYPPQQVSERGVNNLSNLINLGFDVVVSTPAAEDWRKLMKFSFLKFCNWCKSTEQALFSFVPRLAINFNIPLIFWGENPGLQLGDLKTKSKNPYDGKNLKNMNTLQGGMLNWIPYELKKKISIFPYKYPTSSEFKKKKIKIIFLGWFWKDWSLKQNAKISIVNGLEIREKKFKNYGDIFRVTSLDEDWVTFNQLIKYYKYGFGRATDYINEDIRMGIISRADGIKIVKKFDGKYSDRIIENFCKFINIKPRLFWSVVKKNVNRKLFYIKKNKILPKFSVGDNFK